MIGVGVAVRVVVAFATYGLPVDIDNYRTTGDVLLDEGLNAYGALNYGDHYTWPYPPGFLPWILASIGLDEHAGLDFDGLIQLPQILADGAIAWLVQDFLGRRGAGERTRLVAAGLVALGPSFGMVSGYHGQLDSFAILPAVVALTVWDRSESQHRAVYAGALIGLGGCVKTVPLIMVLALLPSARTRREAVTLVAVAAALPLMAIAPFLVADPGGVRQAFTYEGLPGLGGLSLVAQPNLAESWLVTLDFDYTEVSRTLQDNASYITGIAVLVAGAFLLRFRPPAPVAGAFLWLAFYAFGASYFAWYLVWGLPFFLMAGYVWQTALLQAVALIPTILTYTPPPKSDFWVWTYAVMMIALWIGFLIALVLLARRIRGEAAGGGGRPWRLPMRLRRA
jgi:hypothetical protein